MSLLANFLAFQLGWFACVLGAAYDRPWAGPLVVLAIIALHVRTASQPRREAVLVGVAILMGLLVDSLLLASTWLEYPNGYWVGGLAPYWIIAMWALFATTLNRSLKWLHGRPLLAALMGAIGGPLSYLAGARLGAMTLLQPAAAILALALAWSLAMPLLSILGRRLDGISRQVQPPYIQKDWSLTGNG